MIHIARTIRTKLKLMVSKTIRKSGKDLHIGANCRFWAPDSIEIGNCVYIGKNVHIECNTVLGDYSLIANNVAFLGRHDHDFRAIGVPVRLSPWIGSKTKSKFRNEVITIEQDVWIGFGAIILSPVIVGRGSVIAAGSVVTTDVPPYSIVAGNPARIVGMRFEADDIQIHEYSLRNGYFKFSEKGYEDWIVEPRLRG